MQQFTEAQFRTRVNQALERVKTILETTRHPQYAADVPHRYDDKYFLAEALTSSSIVALLTALTNLGATEAQLTQMFEWSRTRTVTLRLRAEQHCKFLRKVVREVESDTKSVSNSTVFGKRESYTVTKVTEYFWQVDASYQLQAFQGTDAEHALVLQQRSGSVELKTSAEVTPRPAHVLPPPLDCNISWLLTSADAAAPHRPRFAIDRAAKKCHTPRRNAQVDAALSALSGLAQWCTGVHAYFTGDLFPIQPNHGLDLTAINASAVFVPVLPLFEEGAEIIPASLPASLQAETDRSLAAKQKDLSSVFPSNDKLITAAEARLLVAVLYAKAVCQAWADGLDYIEDMLRKQLVAAIGKEVSMGDLGQYLRFHYRKLFKPEYAPRGFCYAIRRPLHYPEGTLSIEAKNSGASGEIAEPIQTMVCSSMAARPMRFAIDAATDVSFGGERLLHGWVAQQFSGVAGASLQLVARARQFSSFVLLVGSIASADLFVPKYGLIVQNKDELMLPLLLETIPTPKEFRDAIESLSPEQQRFAKAFRAMQLESTLFGVCVLQIKPALEKLLNLPNDSLTKEIQLGQDLLSLFIEHQVPSDLLTYDGDAGASPSAKVETVKRYVANMQAMVQKAKQAQLDEERQKQQMRAAQQPLPPPAPPMGPPGFPGYPGYAPPPPTSVVYGMAMPAMAMPSMSAMAFASGPPPPPPAACAPPPPPASVPPPAPTPSPIVAASKPVVPTTGGTSTPAQPKPPADKTPASTGSDESGMVDYTKIPTEMEKKFDELDKDAALRPTIITPGSNWSKKFKKTLLSEVQLTTLGTDQQATERTKCFDLLDALTKSGALTMDYATLHVVIASTHCFDKSVMNTIIQDNINPIEKLERSALIVASTVHHAKPAELVAPDQLERVGTYSPMLIEHSPSAPAAILTAAITAPATK